MISGATNIYLEKLNTPPNFIRIMDRQNLICDLKQKLIEALNLKGMSPNDISADTMLFEDGGLGLDSVDALEIVVMLESKFGLTLGDSDDTKSIFKSINCIADYIISRKK